MMSRSHRSVDNMVRVLGSILALLVAMATVQAAVVRRYPPFDEHLIEHPNFRMGPRADVPTYRLPNNTEPLEYDIDLTTNVHTGDTAFKGKVIIKLTVNVTTTEIVLHARQLKNFVATIRQSDTAETTERRLVISQDEDREFLKLSAEGLTFEEDTTWLLTISYEGQLRTDNGGFYLSTYTDENGAKKYLATTQFESTDARHAFPCYDEPAKRANFTITIHHDPSYNAISNMPVDETKTSSGVTAFKTTVKMPTYLVAFIVSQFVYSEGQLNGLTQRVFSRKGTEHEQEWALTTGMLVEKRLSGYFDVPFALPKLDQAALPDFAAGAMENWGLATYREEYLLYNVENSTITSQTSIATVEAHEDTHMWFGDLVAIEWWSYLWLKEGFATLFENLAIDLAYPEWDIFQVFHAGSYQSAMIADALPNMRPMTYYVEKPSEISKLYDSISYAKAGSVLDMWRHALTNTVFQRGLHNYLTKKAYSAANETDLFAALSLAAREVEYVQVDILEDMLSSWTRQGGLPLLTVKRNYDTGSFTIQQEQYTDNNTYQSNKLWYVPVNYAVQSNPDFRQTKSTHYLLNTRELVVGDAKLNNDEWLILNKQSTGYYRINYDSRNWQLIIDGLVDRPHKIHPRNRAQLIADAYRLATSKRQEHSVMLQLLTYLPHENQYAPWAAASSVITLLNNYLSNEERYVDFQFFVEALVREQFDKFGINDINGEQHLAKYTRNLIINLACLTGLRSCLEQTNAKLQALVANGTEIEANLQTPIYCNGLKQADQKTFDYVYNRLMDSTNQAERRLLISALGCAQDEKQLEKYVASSIDKGNKLRTQERITLLSPTYSRGAVGVKVSIDFLIAHYEEYAKLNPGFGGVGPLQSDIQGISDYIYTDSQKQHLQQLIDVVKNTEYVSDTLQQSVDARFENNQAWLRQNREPIMLWLFRFRYARNASPTLTASAFAMALCFLTANWVWLQF